VGLRAACSARMLWALWRSAAASRSALRCVAVSATVTGEAEDRAAGDGDGIGWKPTGEPKGRIGVGCCAGDFAAGVGRGRGRGRAGAGELVLEGAGEGFLLLKRRFFSRSCLELPALDGAADSSTVLVLRALPLLGVVALLVLAEAAMVAGAGALAAAALTLAAMSTSVRRSSTVVLRGLMSFIISSALLSSSRLEAIGAALAVLALTVAAGALGLCTLMWFRPLLLGSLLTLLLLTSGVPFVVVVLLLLQLVALGAGVWLTCFMRESSCIDLLTPLEPSATAMLATLLCTAATLSVSPLEGLRSDSNAADLTLEPFCLLLLALLACVPSGEKDICVASVEELELMLGAGDLGDAADALVITLRGLSIDRS